MMTQKNYILRTAFIFFVWLSLSTSGNTSETQDNTSSTPATTEQLDAPVSQVNSVSFQVFSETPQDDIVIRVLRETQTYNRIKKIIDTNFVLDKPVRLHIQHPKKSQFIATELAEESYVVVLPFSFLHALYQGLSNKYVHQPSAINAIFSTTIEFYVWSEFANYLITEKNLEISGEPYTAKDNFASIMLLNQNNTTSDFITDASEAYLLIHSADEPNSHPRIQNELQRDQQRYRHIVCLTMGFSQTIQYLEEEKDHLDSLSWNEQETQQCQTRYLNILSNWYEAIAPILQENNIIHHWLSSKR